MPHADPERNRQYKREYYQRNKERMDTQAKAWKAANPEKCREYNKRYATKREATPEWREYHRAWQRAWAKANPEVRRVRRLKRKRRLRAVFVEEVLPLVVLERDDGVCGICGDDVDPLDFHLDHVLPLAMGGLHAYFNVQVAHPFCNRSKGVKCAAM